MGRVDDYEAGIVKVTGHSFVRDVIGGQVIEKTDERTKILSHTSGTLIVYQLLEAVALDELAFTVHNGILALSDGREFEMNLAERPVLSQA